jgi:hypothetical protein
MGAAGLLRTLTASGWLRGNVPLGMRGVSSDHARQLVDYHLESSAILSVPCPNVLKSPAVPHQCLDRLATPEQQCYSRATDKHALQFTESLANGNAFASRLPAVDTDGRLQARQSISVTRINL